MAKMTITDLLAWAFRQELSKIDASAGGSASFAPSGSSALSELVALGTVVDRSPNLYGVIPDFVDSGDPHVDAVLVGDAVMDLALHGSFDIPPGWNPFGDWRDEHGLVANEVAAFLSELRRQPDAISADRVVNLVIAHAVSQHQPDWHAREPRAVVVTKQGKPAWFVLGRDTDSFGRVYLFEQDGFDRKRQRPMPGAYRKWRLAGPVRGAALSRLDWQLWQDALVLLHARLDGRLSAHDLLPFTPVRQPWMRAIRGPRS